MQTDVPLLEEIKSLPKKGTVEKGSSAVAQHLTGSDKSLTCLVWGGGACLPPQTFGGQQLSAEDDMSDLM